MRALRGVGAGRGLAVAVAALGLAAAAPARAEAGAYTVYVYNVRSNSGWIRTGFTHDLYASEAACRSSVTKRVNENRRSGRDNEAFAVVYTNARPGAGRLGAFVAARSYIMYIPGQGYGRWAGRGTAGDGTAVCDGGAGPPAPADRRREVVSA